MRALILMLLLTACGPSPRSEPSTPPVSFALDAAPEAGERTLADIAFRAIAICGAKMSEAAHTVLADQVGRAAFREFPGERRFAEAWMGLLCIESKFSSEAKSSVGALGIGQIMPQYAGEFAKSCGLGRIDTKDLLSIEINLRLSACRFRELVQQFDGNIALALSGYNSGAASKTTASLNGLGTGAAETSGYLAKHYVLGEKMRGGQ